jgi:hypothetical protein
MFHVKQGMRNDWDVCDGRSGTADVQITDRICEEFWVGCADCAAHGG